MPDEYKKCSMCKKAWQSRDDFLRDPELKYLGYQVNFKNLEAGLFLFSHLAASCMTTLAIPAGEFFDLYDGPIFDRNLSGTPECPGYCLHESDTSPCPAECECVFVRKIITIITGYKKGPNHEKNHSPE